MVELNRYTSVLRCVRTGILIYVQMVLNSVFQSDISSIVEKGGRYSQVSEGSRTKLVSIRFIAGYLFQAEILVLSVAIENDVSLSYSEKRKDLGNADDPFLKITEHFVRLSDR